MASRDGRARSSLGVEKRRERDTEPGLQTLSRCGAIGVRELVCIRGCDRRCCIADPADTKAGYAKDLVIPPPRQVWRMAE